MKRAGLWPQTTLATVAITALLATAACSPEASRGRGSGPGADVGNRDYPLPELHGARNPAHKTPQIGKAAGK
jgi:hypothetical protein